MKVITGFFKNKNLYLPNKKNLSIKPIGLRVKEAIYNLIQFNINGKKILDLFAGSGQFGIESLSRGAKYVLFVDHSYDSVKLINKNTYFITNKNTYDILMLDYNIFLKNNNQIFDVIFLDPPYHKNILNNILNNIYNFNILNKNSIIICKHHINENLSLLNLWSIVKEKKYGNNKITILKSINKI